CRVPLRNAVISRLARFASPSNQPTAPGSCGKTRGRNSWKRMSWATMTVTGAAIVLARLPADSAGSRRFFAAAERTNTKRPGWELAEVGAILSRSKTWCRSASVTGCVVNALAVCASRNSTSSAAASSMATTPPGSGGQRGALPGHHAPATIVWGPGLQVATAELLAALLAHHDIDLDVAIDQHHLAEAAKRARDRDELLIVVEAVADTLQIERAILVGAAAVDIAQALADEWLEAGDVAGQRGGDARLVEGQDLFEGLGIGHGVSGVGPGWTKLIPPAGSRVPVSLSCACSGRGALPPVGERGAG